MLVPLPTTRLTTAGVRRSRCPAARVLQIREAIPRASRFGCCTLGFTDLKAIFDQGRPRARSAHRVQQSEPVAFPGHRHLVRRRTRNKLTGSRLGSARYPRFGAAAGSMPSLAGIRLGKHAPRACRPAYCRRTGDRGCQGVTRSRARTFGERSRLWRRRTAVAPSARTCRWTRPGARLLSTAARRARSRRSRTASRRSPITPPVGSSYPKHRVGASAQGRRGRDGQGHRHEKCFTCTTGGFDNALGRRNVNLINGPAITT